MQVTQDIENQLNSARLNFVDQEKDLDFNRERHFDAGSLKSEMPEDLQEHLLADTAINVTTQHTIENKESQERNELLNFRQALKEVSIQSLPFSLSRLAVAANSIGNGMVFAKIGGDAIPAGALISTLQFLVVGTFRGSLLSSSNIIGKQVGEKEFDSISRTIWQGWTLGTALSVPTIAVLATSDKIFRAANFPASVAETVLSYYVPFSIGIPATYWFTSDQQFALGIKKPKVTLIAGIAYGGLTMLIGYPLALGTTLGVAGIGWGATASAILCLTGMRLYYYFNPEFAKYKLFTISFKSFFKDFSYMLKLALSMGVQNAIEWGNFFAISLIAGQLGKDIVLGVEPSIHLLVSYNLLLLGQAQATGVSISNAIGTARRANKDNKPVLASVWKRNARMLGHAGLFFGCTFSLGAALLFFSMPNQLTSLFVKDSQAFNNTYSLSEDNLIINGVGLPIDSLRNLLISGLSGLKDIFVAPLLSFVFGSIGGLGSAYLMTCIGKLSSNWIFITRNGGILIASMGVVAQWLRKSSENEITKLINRLDEEENLSKLAKSNDVSTKLLNNTNRSENTDDSTNGNSKTFLSQFDAHKIKASKNYTNSPEEPEISKSFKRSSLCERCVIL